MRAVYTGRLEKDPDQMRALTSIPKTQLRFPRPKGLDPSIPHCPSCGTEDPELFYKNKHTTYGRQHYCNKCHAFNFRPGEIPRELLLQREREAEAREANETLALLHDRLDEFLAHANEATLEGLAKLEHRLAKIAEPAGREGEARAALDARLYVLAEAVPVIRIDTREPALQVAAA